MQPLIPPPAVPSVRPGLYALPLTVSRYGLPDGYTRGVQAFEQATADYQAGHASQAAVKFISVADALRAPKQKTTYTEQFAAMREVAYRNAALAYEQASLRSAGKKALTEALAKDPENAQALRTLLTRFP